MVTRFQQAYRPELLHTEAPGYQPAGRYLVDESLPSEQEGGAAAESQRNAARVRHASRILIVDDDPSIRVTLSAFLEAEGYLVGTAINGEDALEHVDRERPTVVLLDMRMPIMDGWIFARELRARGVEVPLVAMTAAQDARRWAAEIDAAAYVAKPFDVELLLSTLDKLCNAL